MDVSSLFVGHVLVDPVVQCRHDNGGSGGGGEQCGAYGDCRGNCGGY